MRADRSRARADGTRDGDIPLQDALTLSYNTVKTHVKRIYKKLDVHSQQELIDLAENSTAPESQRV